MSLKVEQLLESDSDPLPALKNDTFLSTCRGIQCERTPVWIMRQAGRYLPEFRELRAKYSFFEVCRTPSLACEATLMPLKRYDLDAAIIFCDILVIPQALGMELEMVPDVGPVFSTPLEPEMVDKLNRDNVMDRLLYVFEAVRVTLREINGDVPLIGFCGSPWTLMAYMVEGRSSKTFSKAVKWLYRYPKESRALLSILTEVVIDFLYWKIKCGVHAVQIFDTCAENLSHHLFTTFDLTCLELIVKGLHKRLGRQGNLNSRDKFVPIIIFAKGINNSGLQQLSQVGFDVVSLDCHWDPQGALQSLKTNVSSVCAFQGNLDPIALFSDEPYLRDLVQRMLKDFRQAGIPVVANLGHGILPDTPPKAVSWFIDAVRQFDIDKKAIK